MKFYSDSKMPKSTDKRKTLHQAKNIDLDKVLLEGIHQQIQLHGDWSWTKLKIMWISSKFVANKDLTVNQVYNDDEPSVYWRYIPRETCVTADEMTPTGVKDAKDMLTMLACANTVRSYKLLVEGKSFRHKCTQCRDYANWCKLITPDYVILSWYEECLGRHTDINFLHIRVIFLILNFQNH